MDQEIVVWVLVVLGLSCFIGLLVSARFEHKREEKNKRTWKRKEFNENFERLKEEYWQDRLERSKS